MYIYILLISHVAHFQLCINRVTFLYKYISMHLINLIKCHVQPLDALIYSFKINHTNHIKHLII